MNMECKTHLMYIMDFLTLIFGLSKLLKDDTNSSCAIDSGMTDIKMSIQTPQL